MQLPPKQAAEHAKRDQHEKHRRQRPAAQTEEHPLARFRLGGEFTAGAQCLEV